jgi:hypothetical protein
MLNAEDLRGLGHWARVAFACRCARRLLPVLPESSGLFLTVKAAIDEAEKVAAGETRQISEATLREVLQAKQLAEGGTAGLAIQSAHAVLMAAASMLTSCYMPAGGYSASVQAAYSGTDSAAEAVQLVVAAANSEKLAKAVLNDFSVLKSEYKLDQSTWWKAIDRNFFVLHSYFELAEVIHEYGTILDVSSVINRQLVEYFRLYPNRLFDLAPRQFEELVAELWAKFGWDVELTVPSRDGGRDVIAVKYSPAKARYLLECKRWNRKVGVQVVRSFHGVVEDEQATKGLLVTTARFTGPAQEYLDRHPWRLEGRDFEGVVQWLELYCRLSDVRDFTFKL